MSKNKLTLKLVPARILTNITTTTYEKVLNCLKELKEFFQPINNKNNRMSVSVGQMNCNLKTGFDSNFNSNSNNNPSVSFSNSNLKGSEKENSQDNIPVIDDQQEYFINNINFIIEAIQSQNLYDYSNDNYNDQMENDGDLSSALSFLNSYSNQKVNQKKNTRRFTSVKTDDLLKLKKFAKISTVIDEEDEEIEENINISVKKRHSIPTQQFLNSKDKFFRYNRGNLQNDNNPIKKTETCLKIKKSLSMDIIDESNSHTENLINTKNSKKTSIFHFNEDNNYQTNNLTELKNGLLDENTLNKLNNCSNFSSSLANITNLVKDPVKDPHDIFCNDFNIFELTEKIGQINVLPTVVNTILSNIDIFLEPLLTPYISNDIKDHQKSFKNIIDLDKLKSFSVLVREKYNQNPYHNSIHGTDVFHSVHQIFHNSPILKWAKLNSIDVVSCLIAALVHDIGHPGFNNNFMINSKTDLALLYNDRHVLENFHAAEGYKILSNSNTNIFNQLDDENNKYLRKRFIQLILATDPILHSRIMCLIKNKLTSNEVEDGENVKYMVSESRLYEDQQEILDFLMSFCDTAHSCRKFEITFNWTSRLMEEFWHQGDVEKELRLPVSFLCDRVDAFVGKGQIGFIQAIIVPSVTSLVTMCPSLKYLMDNLNDNINKWQEYLNSLNQNK